jgi:Spy/CpxP family protein refolding chaperone
VNLSRYIRYILLGSLMAVVSLAAHAQGRPGGGPPGGGMGGMMGGPRGGEMNRNNHIIAPRTHTEPQLSLPGRWWDDRRTVKTLNLRGDQQRRMDDIFNAGKGNLSTLFENLQHEQQRFTSMSTEDLQDENKVFAEIDRVAQCRAELEKANFHLLLQIRGALDPDQLNALDREIASNQ